MAISASDIRGLFFGRMEAGKLGIRSVELGIIKTQKGNRICYGWISLLFVLSFCFFKLSAIIIGRFPLSWE
jgi:hypothetical protein